MSTDKDSDSPNITPIPSSTINSTPTSNSTSTPNSTPCSSNNDNLIVDDCVILGEGSEKGSFKRRLTFVVWNHFKKQKINGVDKAICNYCKRKLEGESKNGTKHLHEYIKICLYKGQKDIRQSLLNPNREKNNTLGLYNFDQKAAKRTLAR